MSEVYILYGTCNLSRSPGVQIKNGDSWILFELNENNIECEPFPSKKLSKEEMIHLIHILELSLKEHKSE